MNKYGSYNFKRKVKKKINASSSYSIEAPRSSGRILSAPNYSDNCVWVCFLFFFCAQIDDAANFHPCQILSLDKRVRKIALELVDTKLLAKLSEYDMIATDVKYLQDYTMPIVIATHRNLLNILLWKSFKVHFII